MTENPSKVGLLAKKGIKHGSRPFCIFY